ncbi:uncharacterized protein PHACADRAFT_210564 [Phanerochaete carnosa HHB-10118-sp]|uniref:Uncharacterized protein n=1 Tax=Phanerochaete carnosa (strain HHB-10118-sp) TaxID=650164 RepID=K5UXF6_PHACS|nr:uncharacterized protein PHACADRAFT_210564 [Phanerochaete carnosa HHB-10118-sp]EKM54781.1 hypothetical protein PHACADRAFT_210564 [Phanerochaete carnosa HHB-10118-sp]
MAASPKVEYVIFDMDGLLIDSERVYTEVTNNILARYGKEMTWDIKAGLMGKPEREAAAHLLSFFPDLPPDFTIDTYLSERRAGQDALSVICPGLTTTPNSTEYGVYSLAPTGIQ